MSDKERYAGAGPWGGSAADFYVWDRKHSAITSPRYGEDFMRYPHDEWKLGSLAEAQAAADKLNAGVIDTALRLKEGHAMMDDRLIEPFLNDLEGVTPEQVDKAIREAEDELERLEPRLEALTAWRRKKAADGQSPDA